MWMDAAGRVEFGRSFADAIPREVRAAAKLESLRRDYPRFAIERCLSPDGALVYYSATRRAGERGVHPYYVSRSDLGDLRRELAAGEGHR
jgi:hypothetical protein